MVEMVLTLPDIKGCRTIEMLNNDDYEDYTKIFKNENEYE